MKRSIITFLIILLAVGSCGNFASAESEIETGCESETENMNSDFRNRNFNINNQENNTVVTAKDTGYLNITFSDGYNGYCINENKYAAVKYEKFSVKNTTEATNSLNHESIGNYLKILFVEYHDNVTRNTVDTQNVIWEFSNGDYKSSQDPLVQGVLSLARQGLNIPDHGYIKEISNQTKATFDFEVLDSHNNALQNFFGYKISYEDIIRDIVNESDSNDGGVGDRTEEPRDNASEVPDDDTLLEAPENNETEEEEIPETNDTPIQIPENNSDEELVQPNENITQNPEENNTNENITQPNENITQNPEENITAILPETDENQSEKAFLTQENENLSDVESNAQTEESKETNLLKYKTGFEFPMTLVLIIILGCVLYLHCRRD